MTPTGSTINLSDNDVQTQNHEQISDDQDDPTLDEDITQTNDNPATDTTNLIITTDANGNQTSQTSETVTETPNMSGTVQEIGGDSSDVGTAHVSGTIGETSQDSGGMVNGAYQLAPPNGSDNLSLTENSSNKTVVTLAANTKDTMMLPHLSDQLQTGVAFARDLSGSLTSGSVTTVYSDEGQSIGSVRLEKKAR